MRFELIVLEDGGVAIEGEVVVEGRNKHDDKIFTQRDVLNPAMKVVELPKVIEFNRKRLAQFIGDSITKEQS